MLGSEREDKILLLLALIAVIFVRVYVIMADIKKDSFALLIFCAHLALEANA